MSIYNEGRTIHRMKENKLIKCNGKMNLGAYWAGIRFCNNMLVKWRPGPLLGAGIDNLKKTLIWIIYYLQTGPVDIPICNLF